MYRGFSGLLVKIGRFGNEIGYVPQEASQGIQILGCYQPKHRFDIDSTFLAHQHLSLNSRTLSSLLRCIYIDAQAGRLLQSPEIFFKKIGENLTSARSTIERLKKHFEANSISDYGARESGKSEISDRESHILNAICARETWRL